MASAGSPKSAAAKKRRPRDSLSRAVIIAAAEKIAERDGLEGLTFGALGKELNAHSTSIYRHFRDKDDLVLELIDGLRAKSYGGDLVSTGDWREDLRLIARLIHEHYLRYAGLAMQMAARTTRRPTEFHNVEFALDALRRAGLDDDEAVVTTRVFGNFVRAASALEASLQVLPEQTRMMDELAWTVEYRRLPAEEYPNIARLADKLLPLGDPRLFTHAVEMLLDAIAARAEAKQSDQSDD
ncbi:TetR/AcrR family transcriptional regulator [Amycolatopsis sp. GM8]|uniref:TetR/AcrR family transcriptional regulator n=1 Tax=Amycolatopsis sp. GM8 TaxID=2896530 RepID=UPI001F2EC96B|nr:TetR/AcrR family transcriptional regulator [Amycolatopsis sp. GM8]